jgi:alpha-beta hydrolase superfamily lysophospholipase
MAVREFATDVLGAGFTARTLDLGRDEEGPVVATLVRLSSPHPTRTAVLYVHGFNDYFFQRELAEYFTGRGQDFYGLDLRKYGRSLRGYQTPNSCRHLSDYDSDLDAAVEVVLADGAGHEALTIVAHSTGGLIVPLWLARRRELPVSALILNSPFFDIPKPALTRATLSPLVRLVARRAPQRVLPDNGTGLYGESLHRQFRGEWDYNLDWKPKVSFPYRFGWLAAVIRGQRRLHQGLGLELPILVMCSTRHVSYERWHPDIHRGDAVLNPADILRSAPALGTCVTSVQIPGGMHDLFLSQTKARQDAYDALSRWLLAYG